MSEHIRLYTQDYSTVLFATDDRASAEQFLRGSGEDSLPIVIDLGNSWKQLWCGRLVLDDGDISTVAGDEFLRYMDAVWRKDCPGKRWLKNRWHQR